MSALTTLVRVAHAISTGPTSPSEALVAVCDNVTTGSVYIIIEKVIIIQLQAGMHVCVMYPIV